MSRSAWRLEVLIFLQSLVYIEFPVWPLSLQLSCLLIKQFLYFKVKRVFLTIQKNTCSNFSTKKKIPHKEIFVPLQRERERGGVLCYWLGLHFFQPHAHQTFWGAHTYTHIHTHTHTHSLSLSLSRRKKTERVSVAHNAYTHPKLKKYENIITK